MLVNGVYEPTSELTSGGVTVYRKVGDADLWLEYHAGTGQWQVKPTDCKGKDADTAHCAVPAKCLPEACPVGQWKVSVDGILVFQATVTMSIASQADLEAHKAAMAAAAAEAARQVIGTKHVRLAGATGKFAAYVNGVYEPTSELSCGATVYRKVGEADRWLEYYAGTGQWQAKNTAFKGKGVCYAYCAVPAKCLPEACPVGQWKIIVPNRYVTQASITVSIVS